MAIIKDRLILKGQTYRTVFWYRDAGGSFVPLTLGYTGKMQVRTSAGALVLDLSTQNGRFTFEAWPAGAFPDGLGARDVGVVEIDHADSDGLTPGAYLYDLWVTNGDDYRPLFKGRFVVEAAQTQF